MPLTPDADEYVVLTFDLTCGHQQTGHIVNLLEDSHLLTCSECGHKVEWDMFRPAMEGWNIRCRTCNYRRIYRCAPFTAHTRAIKHCVERRHIIDINVDGVHQHTCYPKPVTDIRLDGLPSF